MAQRTTGNVTRNRTTTNRTVANRANSNRRNAARGNMYVYDNTARQLDVRRQLQEAPRPQLSNETRKNRDKAQHMNPGYVLFLLGAVCICAIVLINYVQLQSEITATVKQISTMESQLNTMQMTNEETYNRIVSNVDLEEVRKIAIGELGMTYAKEGQIITYENAGSDYMRRVSE